MAEHGDAHVQLGPHASNYSSDGWSHTGYTVGPAWMIIVALIIIVAMDIVLVWYGWVHIRSTKKVALATSMRPHGKNTRFRGSVDLDIGDLPMQAESSDVETSSASRSSKWTDRRGSSVDQNLPIVLTEGPQIIIALVPPLSGALMLVSPLLALFVSFPVILGTLAWAVLGRKKSAAEKPSTMSTLSTAISFATIPRTSLRRSLPPKAVREKPWRFPWVTMLIILVIEIVYAIDVCGQALFSSHAIMWKAATADAAGREPWWWGLFMTTYNFEYTLHLSLIFVVVMFIIYGIPAEAAWGPLCTYSAPLVSALIFPFMFYPNNTEGNMCGRWASGSSIFITALSGSILSHASINAHRWPALELPHLFALHLWAWIFMIPVSYAPGSVCIQGHGAGFMLGGMLAMIMAPLFSEKGVLQCCSKENGFDAHSIDVWRWGWAGVGFMGMVIATAVAFTVDSEVSASH